jgi:parallel beta-helix repeat protein
VFQDFPTAYEWQQLNRTDDPNMGAGMLGYGQNAYAAGTIGAKLREWVSVRDAPYLAKGDGSNETAILNACYAANQGKAIDHGDGYTYGINATLTMYSGSRYHGRSVIKQITGAAIANPMISGTSVSNVVFEELEIDGNQSGNSATQTYGIKFSGGTNNTIHGINVHDTTQAGIYLESEAYSKIVGNQVINCGINLGTDNHGIMMVSTTSTPLSAIICSGNTVKNAYRKGITVYNATPGVVNGVTIEGNSVSDCGTGGIYTANANAVTHGFQNGIAIIGNRCYNNYVHIECDSATGATVSGNTCDTTSGGQGIYSADCVYSSFTGNTVVSSQADGMKFIGITINPTGLTISGNVLALSSQAGAGTYHGVLMNGVTYSNVTGNVMLGESGTPKQGYGIYETGAADYNLYADNRIANTQSGLLVVMTGANNSFQVQSGKLSGFNTGLPLNTVDITGGLSIRDQVLTLVNGANNNLALPTDAGTLYVSGPTAVFNISGVAGGTQGRKITIVNNVGFTMTINHNSGSSSAGNKVFIGGSADLAIAQYGSVELTYINGASAWYVTAYKA